MNKPVALGVLLLGFAAGSEGHNPEGELFYAAQFPDHAVPVIDGYLDDWELVPERYSIRNDSLFELTGYGLGWNDPEDMQIWHRIGFNATTERIYFASVVFDEHHNLDRIDRDSPRSLLWDDHWEVWLNPTAVPSLEQNVLGEPPNSISYILTVPPVEGIYQAAAPNRRVYGTGYGWLLDTVEFGWSYTGTMVGIGESTYVYEMSTTPVMALGGSAAETEFMDLAEGSVLHFDIYVPDRDDLAHELDPQEAYCVGTAYPKPECDLLLASLDHSMWTAVEAISWGLIKAGLGK